MFSRRLKTGYLVIEGLNSFATVYFFYYFYFFMQQAFGFGTKADLVLAALNGGSYAIAAWWGGRFAQRFGYFTALKLGYGIMAAAQIFGALTLGARLGNAAEQIILMVIVVFGMSFTWPTLEALVSENETPSGLQHMVGLYNVTWAGTAALSNFIGGALVQHLGFHSLFYIPAAINLCQLAMVFWFASEAKRPYRSPLRELSGPHPAGSRLSPAASPAGAEAGKGVAAISPVEVLAEPLLLSNPRARGFLRMAWLANPCAYIAINTLIAAMPGVAHRLGLSTMLAGFCCSVWCFARLAAFITLWRWDGWHYRFRWLLIAYLGLVASFAAVLLTPNIALLVSAQILFGCSVGLIYYSSLFYSMDRSDTKGEYGGIHEAAIGLGNCAGPVVGAAALQFLPQYPDSGAIAVTLLLLCGLGALTVLWRSGR
jgi:predicted MFS family arabinose efflux permease